MRVPGSSSSRASSGCGPTGSTSSTCTTSATRSSGATTSSSSATAEPWAALREAKRQGVVRFIGASGHLHPTRFHHALDSGEIDVLMNAVNFVVQHTYNFEHKVWSRARHMNVGLVAMKVLGGAAREQGGFKMDEKHYEKAIRYALSIPGIAVAVIGLENIAELEKAASVVARAQPLSPEESLDLARLGLDLAGTAEWKTAYGTPLA